MEFENFGDYLNLLHQIFWFVVFEKMWQFKKMKVNFILTFFNRPPKVTRAPSRRRQTASSSRLCPQSLAWDENEIQVQVTTTES